MARIVTAHYVDDLDNTTLSDDARVTVPFAYRGEEFSVDLTADNAAQFDNDMSKWIEAAKRGQARSAGAEAGNAEPGGAPRPRGIRDARRDSGKHRQSLRAQRQRRPVTASRTTLSGTGRIRTGIKCLLAGGSRPR